MTFEEQLNALIFFHLEEHTSARHLVQVLREDSPEKILHQKTVFAEVPYLKQLISEVLSNSSMFSNNYKALLPKRYSELGDRLY